MTVNALAAADRVIVPVQAEYLALEGLVQFLETLDLVRRNLNPALILTGVLITMHDERTRLARDVEAELRTASTRTGVRYSDTREASASPRLPATECRCSRTPRRRAAPTAYTGARGRARAAARRDRPADRAA